VALRRHFVVWGLLFLASFTVLGLVPSDYIPQEGRVVAVAGVTAGAAVLTLLFLRLAWRPVTDASGNRRRRLRLSVRSLLVLVAACGAAAALWTHFQIEKRLRFGPYAYGIDFPP
jgi:hypothetical protein